MTDWIDKLLGESQEHEPPPVELHALRPEDLLVDLRTPSEFDQGHIPGARSLPIFTDEERARIGTTYKQIGADEARDLGVELIRPRLDELVSTLNAWFSPTGADTPIAPASPLELSAITSKPTRIRLVLHCWRGGMRSRLFGGFCRSRGLPAFQLVGGYKAHRTWSLRILEDHLPGLVSLHGHTGSGKTVLIKRLAKQRPVIDLEGLANHRGSAFGHVGLGPQPSQRQFESKLAAEITRIHRQPVLIEGESANIGRIRIPSPFLEAMQLCPRLVLVMPRETRTQILMEEYAQAIAQEPDRLENALIYLKGRRSHQLAKNLQSALDAKDWNHLCDLLLEEHYDPLYERHLKRHNHDPRTLRIEAKTLDEAEEKILEVLERHHPLDSRSAPPDGFSEAL